MISSKDILLWWLSKNALQNSGKFIPWNVVTIATDGTIFGFFSCGFFSCSFADGKM
jgi:hypothetical protein